MFVQEFSECIKKMKHQEKKRARRRNFGSEQVMNKYLTSARMEVKFRVCRGGERF